MHDTIVKQFSRTNQRLGSCFPDVIAHGARAVIEQDGDSEADQIKEDEKG
jgi:very-short-patch-repair endonuclease